MGYLETKVQMSKMNFNNMLTKFTHPAKKIKHRYNINTV